MRRARGGACGGCSSSSPAISDRGRWDAFEAALAREAAGVEAEAEAARRGGRTPAAAAALTAFMDRSVDAYLAEAEELARELGG